MSAEGLIAGSLLFGLGFTLVIGWIFEEKPKQQDPTDFIGRMDNGETLTKDNIFGERHD
jgi:hypothetical protein